MFVEIKVGEHRADIDGLRAVAVLAVILFHAGLPGFSGGYVGVDVFFVISGYLITSILAADIDRNAFSLARFYGRRIRRIFPALFVVLAFCGILGWLIMTPDALERLGRSVAATSLFFSNILFWRQNGYFATPLAEQPLLQTWSLAVEEQFYILFPLYLAGVSILFPKRRLGLTIGLGVGSFLLSVAALHRWPNAAFFSLPTRAWELLIGSILSLGALSPSRDPRVNHLVSLGGLLFIVVSICTFSRTTPFPGAAALLPTLGAAMILWSGANSRPAASALLSAPPLTFVGKISYSLYLWHFPLLAFALYVSITGLSSLQRLQLIALSFVLATLSWRFVEQPFRSRSWTLRPVAVPIWTGGAASIAFALLGISLAVFKGFPHRLNAQELADAAEVSDYDPRRYLCLDTTARDVRVGKLCKIGARNTVPSFVLWGDSHAEVLAGAIGKEASAHGREGLLTAQYACAPLAGVERDNKPVCHDFNDAVFDLIKASDNIRDVILAARWALWSEGSKYGRNDSIDLSYEGGGQPVSGSREIFWRGLNQTLADLKAMNKRVWIIGPIPEIGYDVPKAMYLQSRGLSESVNIRPSLGAFDQREQFVLSSLNAIQREYPMRIIYPHQVLCRDGSCEVELKGRPIYVDDNHLSRRGAASLADLFEPIFK